MWNPIKEWMEKRRLRQRVAKGRALLSDKQLSKVDLPNLFMSNITDCVLGQIYGDYDDGLYALGIDYKDSEDYGFTAKLGGDYNLLTDEWKKQITARRASHV